ncbi:pRiA4b ORF-3-like protein [Bacillus sp. 491mf]|uniref:plasmid pRiA4b ORF-3 family protein n=1 Tax=unclassified Bacillus (in: firmicutes) TaxID=185979 RepID=UPI00068C6141|nr:MULTISPECIES: plasmid pRiA4b ORF-3 family protein [unclassified Bacillus (in: firmicutes)]SFC85094.1 pRiA4b ORF-3-like protein [Bacillus sp. 491mf]
MLINKIVLDLIEEIKKTDLWTVMPPVEKERLAEIIAFVGGQDVTKRREKKSVQPAIYQFKITLKGMRPPIWRRFLIDNQVTFEELHTIIQIVMGWEDSHLYNFDTKDALVEILDDSFEFFPSAREKYDARETQIGELITEEKQKCLYTYDFGDDWEHELVLEKILPIDEKITVPTCLKGKRACPPEDCGGVYMYSEIQAALKGEGELDEEMIEWLGEFDTEEFDIEFINSILKHYAVNR